jgi:dTDP-4-amino-4,6-dideoxygalactose transaminase
MNWKVPLFDLDIGDAEREAVNRVLDSRWLTMGEEVQAFEKEFAAHVGADSAVAVANCTAALHLCLRAMDVGPGDEILCPSLNFCAGPNVISALGAKVVFTDVTSTDDLCISPEDIAAKITPRTKAIMVMHYAGYPCDMDAIHGLAREHGLRLIEDAAHAPGASLDGRPCGSLGDAACFSFYSNKNMSTGEGGMVTTSDDTLGARMRHLRSHGMTASTLHRHKGHAFSYDLVEPGYNYRLDEMRAAMGRVQLSRLDGFNERRAELVAAYRRELAGAEGISLPFVSHRGTSAYHIMPALLDPGVDREKFMQAMKGAGIQTSIHYPPSHLFGWYRQREPELRLSVTEEVAVREVTLPLFASMEPGQVSLVCGAIREYFKRIRKAA